MIKALVIVDVQKEFNEYIQHDLVDALSDYAEKFDTVYQIWDTHKNTVGPTHSFPGQIDSIPKKFGKKHFSDEVTEYIEKIKKSSSNGRTFKLSDEEGYIVRVKNNHDWFYVNPEIVELISKLKGKKVILAGGADGECLEDIYQAFLAFGLNTHINKKYTYSAKTSQEDSIQESKVENYPFNKIVFKVNDVDDGLKIIWYLEQLFPTYKISHRFHESDIEYPNYAFIPINYLMENPPENTTVSVSIISEQDTEETLDNLFRRNQTNMYDKDVLTIKDIDMISTILRTGKRIKKPSYEPKKFIYESTEIPKKNSIITFYPQTDEELIEAQEIAFKNGWMWASCATKPIYKYLYGSRMLIYSKDDKKIRKGDFRAIRPDEVIASDLKELSKLLSNRPTYEPRKFVYESNNDIEKASEICVFIDNEEDYNKLSELLKEFDVEDYEKYDYYNQLMGSFKEDRIPYFYFIQINDGANNGPISWYDSSDPYEQDFLMHNNIKGCGETNGVYKQIFDIDDDKETIKRSITNRKVTIVPKRPSYEPRKFIYERKNNKQDATEIVIILNTKEELDTLQKLLDEIKYDKKLSFVKKFPCVVYLDIKRVDGSWGDSRGHDYESVIKNDIKNNSILDGVYEKPFTIKDIKSIKKTLVNRRLIHITEPTYKPKKFIYEKFDPKTHTVVFEPSSPEECIKAQEIAFKCGWGWGGRNEKEVQYTSKEESMFLTFSYCSYSSYNNMLRIPERHYLETFDEYGDKMEALKNNTSGEIIYTTSLSKLHKLLSDKPITPTYEPRKFIY